MRFTTNVHALINKKNLRAHTLNYAVDRIYFGRVGVFNTTDLSGSNVKNAHNMKRHGTLQQSVTTMRFNKCLQTTIRQTTTVLLGSANKV